MNEQQKQHVTIDTFFAAKPGEVMLSDYTFVDVRDMKPEQISIEVIANALAKKPRFNGHTKKFKSVAEHSISVSNTAHIKYLALYMTHRNVSDVKFNIICYAIRLFGLLHDAHEAYLFDIPSPFKIMEEFKPLVKLEAKIQVQIEIALALSKIENKAALELIEKEYDFITSIVKTADKQALQSEVRELYFSDSFPIDGETFSRSASGFRNQYLTILHELQTLCNEYTAQ